MIRTLRLLALFFSFHPLMLVAVIGGFVTAGIGLLNLLADRSPILIMAGNMLFLMPVLWSSGVFRELLGNRLLSLAPGFRGTVVTAYLLEALAVSLIYSAFMLGATASHELAATTLALTFAAVSFYLLTAQWTCTQRYGWLIQVGLFLGGLNLVLPNLELAMIFTVDGIRPLGWALVALLGWTLLYRRVARAGMLAGPTPSQRMERWSSSPAENWTGFLQLPRVGHAVIPARALMRGMSDSLSQQVWMALLWIGWLAGIMLLWFLLMQFGRNGPRQPDWGLFLVSISFASVSLMAPLTIGEWSARLRTVWLRSGANRAGLWQVLERALREQTLVVIAVATVAAAVLHVAVATPLALLAIYVSGCGLAMPFGAYLMIWCRARGLSSNGCSYMFMLIWILIFWAMVGLYLGYGTAGIAWLLPVFGLLATGLRRQAKRTFSTIDWCRVRPARLRRAMLPVMHSRS